MHLIVGVDGGGTKTRCAVSDGATILGRGVSNGCNIVRLGEATARASIQSAIRKAFHAARLKHESAQAACIGVAGSAVPHVREAILSIVREVLTCPIAVVGDQEIAFEAAFGDSAGILVIGGTGSIAFGRGTDGRAAHSGGHGFIISDEGSGQWIGRTAVADCLRALDAGAECELMPLLLKAFHVSTVGELIQAANAVPLPNFSELLPIVLAASRDGDAIAIELLKKAGRELAALAKLVAVKLAMEHESFRVAMAGGVFEHCTLVREEFESSLRSSNPQAIVIGGVVEPLLGALALAGKVGASECQLQLQ
jgi:glucosamine kinase